MHAIREIRFFAYPVIVLLAVGLTACSDGNGVGPNGDITPPAQISDLRVDSLTGGVAYLSWTAPGDDSITGTASSYDARYTYFPLTDRDWGNATFIPGVPNPAPAGSVETMAVAVFPDRSYYFAIKAVDDAGNHSRMSNVAASQDDVAENIALLVYSNGWGTLLDSIQLASEGPATIDVYEEDPYSDPPSYYVYAIAEGFYTELYGCFKGETITVDLDPVPSVPGSMTGVIFGRQIFFSDHYYGEDSVLVTGPHSPLIIVTDDQGRFALWGMPLGGYTLSWMYSDHSGPQTLFEFTINNTDETDYSDLSYLDPYQMMAPNIYLYPEVETRVKVRLGFPHGGFITESEPSYGRGWDVTVDPDGVIDGRHDYLFYEATLNRPLDCSAGWILDGSDLEGELRALLERIGFIGQEVDDFVNHWVRELEGSPWYAVYPQDAGSMITLDISPTPDNVLRAFFVIRRLNTPISIPEPPVPEPFERRGLTVAEWGVVGLF